MAAYKIVLDAMGGDEAPRCNVEGAVMALAEDQDLSLILTGPEPVLKQLLEERKKAGRTWDETRLSIVHTDEVIANDEHSPAEAVRAKRDSSLGLAFQMVRGKEADGMVSAGNTGVVYAESLFV